MMRLFWLGSVFLAIVCALAALKIGSATSARQPAAFAEMTEAYVSQDPLTKADKLEVSNVDDAPDKIVVKPIDIVLPNAAAKPQETNTKIISRHWHEGNAKMTTQKHHRRDVSRTKHRS
jgi:hypothetical protein